MVSKYGVKGYRVRKGVWEREIGWFKDVLVRRAGNGENTSFWTNPWLEGSPMCSRFSRLFKLCSCDEYGWLGSWGPGLEVKGENFCVRGGVSCWMCLFARKFCWQMDLEVGYSVKLPHSKSKCAAWTLIPFKLYLY